MNDDDKVVIGFFGMVAIFSAIVSAIPIILVLITVKYLFFS